MLRAPDSDMRNEKQALDRSPGAKPDIRPDRGGVLYIMSPAGLPKGEQLIIRCDSDGEVWIALEDCRGCDDDER